MLLTKQEVKMAEYWPCKNFFFLGTKAKGKRPVSSYVNGTIVVSKRFIIWPKDCTI